MSERSGKCGDLMSPDELMIYWYHRQNLQRGRLVVGLPIVP